VVRHRGGLFKRAAILQIGRDPGCPEAVVAELGCDPGGKVGKVEAGAEGAFGALFGAAE